MQVPQVELCLATGLGEGDEGKKNTTQKGNQAFSDHPDPVQVHKPTYLRGVEHPGSSNAACDPISASASEETGDERKADLGML